MTEGLYRKMKMRADDIRPYGKKQGFPEGLPPLSGEVSPQVTEGLYHQMKKRADIIRPVFYCFDFFCFTYA